MVSLVDSLNDAAWRERYRSLDRMEAAASSAMERADGYTDGRMEALCHLGMAKAMRMDYGEAKKLYGQVLAESGNELLRLMADVGMMRVCQRRSTGKEFYDYMNDGERRARRIGRELGDMSDRQRKLWNGAMGDFYMTLSTFYYYLRQEADGQTALAVVDNHGEWVADDSTQMALYLFLRGNERSVEGGLPDQDRRLLMRSMTMALRGGDGYVYAKCMTSLAEDVLRDEAGEWAIGRLLLREVLEVPDSVDDEGLPLWMSMRALEVLQAYGCDFDVAQTCIMVSECRVADGDLEGGLAWLLKARELAERRSDVPELTIDVMEQLSMVYSAMGRKEESDRCRNVYLDVLEATRQDRRMEQRLEVLKAEEGQTNRLMAVAIGVMLLLVGVAVWLSRHIRRMYARHAERERRSVEEEMGRWRVQSDEDFSQLEDEGRLLVAERHALEGRMEGQKRDYVDKAACLSIVGGIRPFLDRAVHEVENGWSLDYVDELVARIEEYNEVLSHWIKVRQGFVSLHVESFALQPLFDILDKSVPLFAAKGIKLVVEPSPAVVKADRTLTLFMMNTLLDNARKFTPEGGRVSLRAALQANYVEVSVEDTGCGVETTRDLLQLSPPLEGTGEVGGGFGLMNCKGIIEKYRKTSPVFNVCQFDYESEVGKGSRFFFRLPKGVLRTLGLLALWPVAWPGWCVDRVHQLADSLPVDIQLERASAYADSAYFANIDGRYEACLEFVDSACIHLNDYYLRQQPQGEHLMHLTETEGMPDIDLWEEGFPTDYHIVLDIRNEAAIAALALNRWNVYHYNNEVYTRLYKLMAQDTTLQQYCYDLEQANVVKQTVLVVMLILILGLAVAYLTMYYRNHILTTFNMRQILELNRRIFSSDDPNGLADIVREGVDGIRRCDGVGLLYGSELHFSADCPRQEYVRMLMQEQMNGGPTMTWDDGRVRLYPLTIQTQPEQVGVLALVLHDGQMHRDDDQLFQLLARYAAINIYYSSLRMEHLHNDIELAEDEKKRAERETNRLHVQNMVLDNCLSTIKHETIYYPSRIRQKLVQLQGEECRDEAVREKVMEDLRELLSYYKEVFTLLSAQASKQLDTVPMQRQAIGSEEIRTMSEKVLQRLVRKQDVEATLTMGDMAGDGVDCLADATLLKYLLESLFTLYLQHLKQYGTKDGARSGEMHLKTLQEGKFLAFRLQLYGMKLSAEECRGVFYPEHLRYDASTDRLDGAGWLIAKQIIREHDDHIRRGCRIEVNPNEAVDGIEVYLTLPLVMGRK